MVEDFSIVAVIPARMASSRFPGKVLHDIHGLPMVEHVRRRAMMCDGIERVVVATCDDAVAAAVRGFGGEVVMTSSEHRNGTTRAAEAVAAIGCTHVVLLQGDEPLLLPRHVDSLVTAMQMHPTADVWNTTGPIDDESELDRHSFVKCAVAPSGRIIHCFRRSPFYGSLGEQMRFVRKVLGVFALRKDFLLSLAGYPPTPIEQSESIEQMRVIENDRALFSVHVEPSLPSVNEPHEMDIVLDVLARSAEQQQLLHRVLSLDARHA